MSVVKVKGGVFSPACLSVSSSAPSLRVPLRGKAAQSQLAPSKSLRRHPSQPRLVVRRAIRSIVTQSPLEHQNPFRGNPVMGNAISFVRRRIQQTLSRATHAGADADGCEPAVVIVDHGSRVASANESLADVVQLYKERTGTNVVEMAHMELAEPTIDDAVARCVEQGATTVVVFPYFLSRGRHVREDIPRLVEQARSNHPNVNVILAEPLGLEPRLADVIASRINSALKV
ncbi:hypothetical protein PPROV_000628000 [Pycnococcus provasolii]|uniref:Sirohydrochlorin ferrochelatase n=1 Tax=Pycnococcus provasolii TaxID=41880 RepID=A0A830HKY4_9CHLO|nr:hypothetical protein PPROV_000628000 [Pycnococcus provasolii]|mmetsp:Transcript_3157/g.7130  ORF Transcript_3157/g.7130 Transcript_3157/m.7130 type:complete len:231 (-) Transcript_3157:25-717(-)